MAARHSLDRPMSVVRAPEKKKGRRDVRFTLSPPKAPARIVFAAPENDYGDPANGRSMEAFTFLDVLAGMGYDVIFAPTDTLSKSMGRQGYSRALEKWILRETPDVMFAVLSGRELDLEAVHRITKAGRTLTLNWFCDDEFRFESFSRHVAPAFRAVVTLDPQALAKYERAGYMGAIRSQWGHNPFVFRPMGLPLSRDVTFVGQPIADRRAMIQHLAREGIQVETWGRGWPAGRLPHEEMATRFNESRINLSFSRTSTEPFSPLARYVNDTWLHRALNRLPGGGLVKGLAKAALTRRRPRGNALGLRHIKARVFEVTGAGGFLLTEEAPLLEEYFRAGAEVATFGDRAGLLAQVRRFLRDEGERRAIAEAGAVRALREHTMVHRLSKVFGRLNIRTPDLDDALRSPSKVPARVLTPAELKAT